MKGYQGILVRMVKSGSFGIIYYREKMIGDKFVVFLLEEDLTPDLDQSGKQRKALARTLSIRVIGYVD